MTDDKDFYKGQIVFDKKRTDPTDDLLVIVDADKGPVAALEGETKRLVKHNDTNKDLNAGKPVADDELCIGAAYISSGDHEEPDIGEKVYTFPEFRLETVESKNGSAIEGYQPYQWALAGFFSELVKAFDNGNVESIEDVEDLQVLCMEASIDGKVITKGTQWGLGKSTPKP